MMEMAKLSEAQVAGLRAVDAGRGYEVNKRTRESLRSRFLIKWDGDPAAWQITPTGRTLLDEYERAERVKQGQAERASRPVPASAFVEPSARTAPVMGLEYDEEPDEVERDEEPASGAFARHLVRSRDVALEQATTGLEPDEDYDAPVTSAGADSGPSVRLTPTPAGVEQEATDAEILQLLTMLDSGVSVSRSLYQEYIVTGMGSWTLNLDAVNRAARDAVRFGLATQEFRERLYRLSAEPIHLVMPDGRYNETRCGFVLGPQAKIRARVTSDPAKVTHERCK